MKHMLPFSFALLMMLVQGTAQAAEVRPSFDANDVVRHIRREHQRGPEPGRGLAFEGFDSGEFLLDTSTAYAPAYGDQTEPAVGFDGTNFLVVWQDNRTASFYIYASRVTPAGVILDPAGIPVSITHSGQHPAVAFDGANYLVVWDSYDIYGARVTPGGSVLDTTGIEISTATGEQCYPAVAFSGSDYLVVWEDYRTGCDVYGARVTPEGEVRDSSGIPISVAADDQWSPAVAFGDTGYLVVWTDCRSGSYDIYGARVSADGSVLDTSGISISAATGARDHPDVAYDGTNFLAVWADGRSGVDIYGSRVTQAGTVLDPAGIAVSTATGSQYDPVVTYDGANYLVAWEDARTGSYDICGARVTPGGAVLDPSGIAVSAATGAQRYPAVTFGGSYCLVVWADSRSGVDIYGSRVTSGGAVLDSSGIAISTAAGSQYSPAVAYDGTNFLAVWQDHRNDTADIYGARVTPAGGVLDPVSVAISTAASYQYSPAVAYGGSNFLVVWQDSRNGSYDIYGARVTHAGAVRDPSGIAISTAASYQYSPAAAYDGTNFLVVWQDSRNGLSDIYGARVTPAGGVLDPAGIAISMAANIQYSPAVAYDGTTFLVVWQDYRNDTADIYGARVTPAGAVLDSAGIAVSTAPGYQYSPAVAYDGTNFLAVWQSGGARVTPSGTVLDPSGIPVRAGGSPDVAFDGTNFLVVSPRYRAGTSQDIDGARVTQSGTVLDTFPVVIQEGNQLYPALARGAGTQMLLAYQGWTGKVGGSSYYANRIWGKLGSFPGVEETMNDERVTMNSLPTIVRGVLELPVDSRQHSAYRAELLDISGRKVIELRAGANDVSRLAPGVYFVREQSASSRQHSGFALKIVVAR